MTQNNGAFGVLFDVGYCLMDERPRLRVALGWCVQQLAAEGVTVTADELERRYDAACCAPQEWTNSLITQILADVLPREQALEIRSRLVWDGTPLVAYPDAARALEMLHQQGFKVGVLANQPPSARQDLQRSGLAARLDDVWLSEEAGLSKPNPAFFRLALDKWQLPAGRVAYIGDRPDNDVRPARALGMLAVRVLLGPHRVQPMKDESERADVTVETLSLAAEALLTWSVGRLPDRNASFG